MALQHHYHPLSFSSCSYERSFVLLPSFYCGNQPAHVCFRPAVNGVVLRWALNKALALVMRGSKNDRDFDLEGEIFAFMRNSAKPDMFPSKEELMAAGRVDLVNAILAEGGWLSAGWDSKEKDGKREEKVENLSINGRSGHVFQNWDVFLGPEFRDSASFGSYQSAESSTSSSQSQETNHDDGGVVGMLSRLEKERAASYAIESREEEGTRSRRDETRGETRYSWEKLRRMYGGKSRHSLNGQVSSVSEFLKCKSGKFDNFNFNIQQAATSDVGQSTSFLSPKTSEVSFGGSAKRFPLHPSDGDAGGYGQILRIKSLHEDNHVTDSGGEGSRSDTEPLVSADCLHNRGAKNSLHLHIEELDLKDERDMENDGNHHKSYQECIRAHIRELETELSSMIKLVRLGAGDHKLPEEYGNPLEKLQELSNEWEFQETEIMKSRAKLRSIRAKFAILEGKMALEIMEAQRLAKEKQKRIEKVQRISSFLRTTSIVWSNSGEDAYLAGSFDGWTSQRRMERTSSGAFVINLKLYPGRYEIKFIVDGVWRTDPLRPIVNNDGHENNLLIVS